MLNLLDFLVYVVPFHCRLEAWSDVRPSAHVLVLLLDPGDLGIRIFKDLCPNKIHWKWRDLCTDHRHSKLTYGHPITSQIQQDVHFETLRSHNVSRSLIFVKNKENHSDKQIFSIKRGKMLEYICDLFHSCNCDSVDTVLLDPFLCQVIVDLSTAEKKLTDMFCVVDGSTGLGDEATERRALGHVVKTGLCLRMSQKTLWCHHDNLQTN